MEWLFDFVYTGEEQEELSGHSARRKLRAAARRIYQTEKTASRGEVGELLLHLILRYHFGTAPVIRKLFFKSAANDTVKGFDNVHVATVGDDIELWMGEVKFYGNLARAMRDVANELRAHAQGDYLRDEFVTILDKIPATFPHRDKLLRLLDPTTSLDHIFRRWRVPVLATYDSKAAASHKGEDPYLEELAVELLGARTAFLRNNPPEDLSVDLIVLPLSTKRDLVEQFDRKLSGAQQ